MLPPAVGYRLVESSSDVVLESEAVDLGAALVFLAQGFSHVVTAGAKVEPRFPRRIEVQAPDPGRLAVAFVQELIYLFDTEAFLPAGGALDVALDGTCTARGSLRGDRFDPHRFPSGTEVKAATLHEALLLKDEKSARARVLLDL